MLMNAFKYRRRVIQQQIIGLWRKYSALRGLISLSSAKWPSSLRIPMIVEFMYSLNRDYIVTA